MANLIPKPLIAALFAAFLITSWLASTDVPVIVAHKKASLTRLKSGGERVSVSIDICNQGSSTAYDVSLTDDCWPQDVFSVISEAKTKGMFYGAPAVITFHIPTEAALQVAYSTPILPLDIFAERLPENKFDWKLLAKFGSQIYVITVVVLFMYMISTPPKSSAAEGTKKTR